MAEYVTKEEVEAAVQKFKTTASGFDCYGFSSGSLDTSIFREKEINDNWDTDGGKNQTNALNKINSTYENNFRNLCDSLSKLKEDSQWLQASYTTVSKQK